MILKDLPKFQNISSDVDVVDLSSLGEVSPGESYKKSIEHGGKRAKAAKASLARAARRGARQEARERHFKRDDQRFYIIQSNIQNMERSIGMLNQELNRKAVLMAREAIMEVTNDEEARAEVKRKISEI
jgi:hypothetical protein